MSRRLRGSRGIWSKKGSLTGAYCHKMMKWRRESDKIQFECERDSPWIGAKRGEETSLGFCWRMKIKIILTFVGLCFLQVRLRFPQVSLATPRTRSSTSNSRFSTVSALWTWKRRCCCWFVGHSRADSNWNERFFSIAVGSVGRRSSRV